MNMVWSRGTCQVPRVRGFRVLALWVWGLGWGRVEWISCGRATKAMCRGLPQAKRPYHKENGLLEGLASQNLYVLRRQLV